MPRNDAAERYSPEMADALSVGGTRRAATRKSAGVRATRTPRAPMTAVTTVTATIAPRTAGSVMAVRHGGQSAVPSFEQLDEALLDALGRGARYQKPSRTSGG